MWKIFNHWKKVFIVDRSKKSSLVKAIFFILKLENSDAIESFGFAALAVAPELALSLYELPKKKPNNDKAAGI